MRMKSDVYVLIVLAAFLLPIVFMSQLALAETVNYPRCKKFGPLGDEENFCPRIEGMHPEGCCPPIQDKKLKCYYARYRSRGQVVVVNSSYTRCTDDGETEKVNCCRLSYQACYDQKKIRTFVSFLNYRRDQNPKGCCFSLCPSASYWSDHPNKELNMPGTHYRLGENDPPNICKPQQINRCDFGGTKCLPNNSCPVIKDPGPTPGDGDSKPGDKPGMGDDGGGPSQPAPPKPVPPKPKPPTPKPEPPPSQDPPDPPPAPPGVG